MGLKLSKADKRTLISMKRSNTMAARTWRRIRVLELLDEGLSVRSAAKAVGSYPREISRIGKRYVASGLTFALTDDPRVVPERKLDSTQEAAIIALVCGPAPEGRARWTVRLITERVVETGIAPEVGRETIRLVLATHDLKPWREKNVVRAKNRPRVHRPNGRSPTRLRSAP